MRFRARFATAAVIPALLAATAACGGSEDGQDGKDRGAQAPGSISTAGAPSGTGPGNGSPAGGNSGIADSTRNHKIVVPDAIEPYTKSSTGSTPGQKEAEGLGVANAQTVSGVYNAPGTDPAKVGGTRLTFDGFYGEIADPAKALDGYLAGIANKGLKGDAKTPGVEVQPVGTAKTVKPAGFDGALMKCQDMKVVRTPGAEMPKDVAEFQFPVCAWADYSTLGGARVVGLAQMRTGGDGVSQDEVAALTAKLYKAARQKA
ncbi:hypothetical protein [Yinghuangia soli]|uniref:Lipoprotein n=1 Tax=Yinghuangia soli TaxID=2908204 RepID=A0AA41PYT4_9ACTN|nr:hypothetical protein [Yinghuangia soli]MCF2526962.1 hypothetical protein [Yinghuangia soli]